jgi:osmotically-inducible protein OsmY
MENLRSLSNYDEANRIVKSPRRDDMQIYQDVCETLESDSLVNGSNIEVSVISGVVTLTGDVDSRNIKRVAEGLSEAIEGVVDVQNNLRIKRWDDYSPNYDTWSKY